MSEENNLNFDIVMKIIIIGDSSVGKTNFLCKFIDDEFSEEINATIGIDYMTKIVRFKDTNI